MLIIVSEYLIPLIKQCIIFSVKTKKGFSIKKLIIKYHENKSHGPLFLTLDIIYYFTSYGFLIEFIERIFLVLFEEMFVLTKIVGYFSKNIIVKLFTKLIKNCSKFEVPNAALDSREHGHSNKNLVISW